jgi:glycosyltransferase involved in cell wall biosynthesis
MSLRVLLIAYECSPIRGHAPGSAWQIISRLAKLHCVHVVVEESQYREEIQDFVLSANEEDLNIHFYFVPSEGKGYAGNRPVLPFRSLLNYKKWHKEVFLLAKKLHAIEQFDIIHLLRGNSFREPGYCWKLDAPYVWGPVGGTTKVPYDYLIRMGFKEAIQHFMRNATNHLQLRYSPRVRSAMRSCSVMLGQTSIDCENFLPFLARPPVLVHEQNCYIFNEADRRLIRKYDGTRKVVIAWVGQFISRKAFPILVDALRRLPDASRVSVRVAGDGPLKSDWISYVKSCGLEGVFTWHGWLSRSGTLELLGESDFLCFTSLLEGTPATVTEALSLGLPVLCCKTCGHGDIVDDSCGCSVSYDEYNLVVDRYAEFIIRLLEDPSLLETLSMGAMRKSRIYTWDNAVKQIQSAYRLCCED